MVWRHWGGLNDFFQLCSGESDWAKGRVITDEQGSSSGSPEGKLKIKPQGQVQHSKFSPAEVWKPLLFTLQCGSSLYIKRECDWIFLSSYNANISFTTKSRKKGAWKWRVHWLIKNHNSSSSLSSPLPITKQKKVCYSYNATCLT